VRRGKTNDQHLEDMGYHDQYDGGMGSACEDWLDTLSPEELSELYEQETQPELLDLRTEQEKIMDEINEAIKKTKDGHYENVVVKL
jgi:hypothetical protein